MIFPKIIFWSDRVMYFCFLPLVFFLPISTAIFEIFSCLIIFSYLVNRISVFIFAYKNKQSLRSAGAVWQALISNCKPFGYPFVLSAGVFVYATFLSVLASQFPALSWRGFFGKTLEATLLFFAVTQCMISRRRLNIFLSIFLVSAVFVSMDAGWQYFFKKDFIFGHAFTGDGRVSSCFGHPNDLGAYLVIPLAFLISLLLSAWSARRECSVYFDISVDGFLRVFVVSIGVFLTAVTLGWTFSRGAWIGFTASMVTLSFINRKKWYFPLILTVIFLVVFASQIGSIRNVSFVTDDIFFDGRFRAERFESGNPTIKGSNLKYALEDFRLALSRFSGTGRFGFWRETVQVALAAPIFGTGLNTYSKAAPRYNKKWTGYYAHNCYLQMLAEIGVVGLASFFLVIYVFARTTLAGLRKVSQGFYRTIIAGLFAGWVGFLVHSGFDTNFYSTRLVNLMWISMGLIVAVFFLAQKENSNL